MSCGVGCRCGLDLVLLWLWCRPAAIIPIGPLAWEPPYAMGAAPEKTKRQNKTKQADSGWRQPHPEGCGGSEVGGGISMPFTTRVVSTHCEAPPRGAVAASSGEHAREQRRVRAHTAGTPWGASV